MLSSPENLSLVLDHSRAILSDTVKALLAANGNANAPLPAPSTSHNDSQTGLALMTARMDSMEKMILDIKAEVKATHQKMKKEAFGRWTSFNVEMDKLIGGLEKDLNARMDKLEKAISESSCAPDKDICISSIPDAIEPTAEITRATPIKTEPNTDPTDFHAPLSVMSLTVSSLSKDMATKFTAIEARLAAISLGGEGGAAIKHESSEDLEGKIKVVEAKLLEADHALSTRITRFKAGLEKRIETAEQLRETVDKANQKRQEEQMANHVRETTKAIELGSNQPKLDLRDVHARLSKKDAAMEEMKAELHRAIKILETQQSNQHAVSRNNGIYNSGPHTSKTLWPLIDKTTDKPMKQTDSTGVHFPMTVTDARAMPWERVEFVASRIGLVISPTPPTRTPLDHSRDELLKHIGLA